MKPQTSAATRVAIATGLVAVLINPGCECELPSSAIEKDGRHLFISVSPAGSVSLGQEMTITCEAEIPAEAESDGISLALEGVVSKSTSALMDKTDVSVKMRLEEIWTAACGENRATCILTEPNREPFLTGITITVDECNFITEVNCKCPDATITGLNPGTAACTWTGAFGCESWYMAAGGDETSTYMSKQEATHSDGCKMKLVCDGN